MKEKKKGRSDARLSRSPLHTAAAWNRGEPAAEQRRAESNDKAARIRALYKEMDSIGESIWRELGILRGVDNRIEG